MIKILGILTLTLATGILHAQDSTQFMNAHVVIADTSSDYYKLRAQMFELSKKLDFKIGTLGRGFDDEHKADTKELVLNLREHLTPPYL
jgi:hypothetical protein